MSATPPDNNDIQTRAAALKTELIEIRRDLHRHPELANRETRTAAKVADYLQQLNLDQITTGVAHTGVVALLNGTRPGPVLAIRADMDALPISETIDVPYKSLHAGIKHACGHDAHTTILLGTAKLLSQMRDKLHGTIKFIFQPAEEGSPPGEDGGATLMIKEGVLEDPPVDAIIGLHVRPHYDTGLIALRGGPVMASADQLKITIKGRQAHAAYPHDGLDAIAIAADVIQQLQTIRSRRISTLEPFVLTIGTINGGTASNILAPEVTMTGTLRAFDPDIREKVLALAKQIIQGVCAAHGATGTLEIKGSNPAVVNDKALTKEMRTAAIAALGEAAVLESPMWMGAEDFAAYQQHIPGCFFFLGVRNEAQGKTAMLHTPEFDIDEDCLPVGVTAMTSLAISFLENRAG